MFNAGYNVYECDHKHVDIYTNIYTYMNIYMNIYIYIYVENIFIKEYKI